MAASRGRAEQTEGEQLRGRRAGDGAQGFGGLADGSERPGSGYRRRGGDDDEDRDDVAEDRPVDRVDPLSPVCLRRDAFIDDG